MDTVDPSTLAARDERAAPDISATLSVIIPHYNDLENLKICLAMLAPQMPADGSCEIIVVDNNSAMGLAAVEAVAGSVARVVLATEQGAGPARNAGVEAARGDILAFTDSDCRPGSEWLAEAMTAGRTAEITGGRVDLVPADPARMTPVEAFEAVFGFNNEVYIRQKGFSGSGNLVVRRPVFLDVGPFRNGMSEDVEWSRRAQSKGYAIRYHEPLFAEHPSRRSWRELERKWKKATSEAFHLHRQKRSWRLRWVARSFAVLLSAIPHTWKLFRSPRLSGWHNKAIATGVLFRVRAYRFVEGLRLAWTDGR